MGRRTQPLVWVATADEIVRFIPVGMVQEQRIFEIQRSSRTKTREALQRGEEVKH